MTIYDELVARGLIAQVTDEEEIKELVNNGKATFYIGFDPTADSLHVGHFMALCLMKRLQMAGNKPIALIGGGTAMVGDPSGRSDMRQMMTQVCGADADAEGCRRGRTAQNGDRNHRQCTAVCDEAFGAGHGGISGTGGF